MFNPWIERSGVKKEKCLVQLRTQFVIVAALNTSQFDTKRPYSIGLVGVDEMGKAEIQKVSADVFAPPFKTFQQG